MVLQVKQKTELYKVASFGGIPNVFFEDLLGTESDKVANPIVGSWFRIESGPEATPPKYEYDEVGVVIEGSYTSSSSPSFRSFLFLTWVDHIGEINMRDETGQSITVKQGDTFFFPRGSTITFS
ncbi:hypothetical protein ZTR_02806 [Talaromyces verruculosus]|nr:hypothetical protein ZTR_02806 [Talaromyces verruculosus]